MKHTLILLLLAVVAMAGCKTNRFKDNKRVGLWIETDTVDGNVYSSRGRYKNGTERKTWKYFNNGRLYKKEIYADSICQTTFFHPNGNKMLEGVTKLSNESKLLHWYYDGQWKQFDSTGVLVDTRIYERGVLLTP